MILLIVSNKEANSDDLTRKRRRKSLERLKEESKEIDKKPYQPSPPIDEGMENPRKKKKIV